jgi:putative hydrolase of HD superfamily
MHDYLEKSVIMKSYQAYIQFFFELDMLKKIHRQGWKLIGISELDTVAGHSLRAAQIGYILAKLEGYDNPDHVVTILIFHDVCECRTGDIHKVANRYISLDERSVICEQMQSLGIIGDTILDLWNEIAQQSTTAGIIAKDADLLEMIVTAVEIMKRKGIDTNDWIENTENRLMTYSAKKLFQDLKNCNPDDWWRKLKKI